MMKRILSALLCAAMLTGCAAVAVQADDTANDAPLLILANPTISANPDLKDILIAPNPMAEKSDLTDILIAPNPMAEKSDLTDILIAPNPMTEKSDEEAAEDAVEALVGAVGVEIVPFEVSKKVRALVIGDSNACAYGSANYIALNAATAEAPIEGSFGDIATKELIGGSKTAAMFAMPGATTANVLDLFTNPEKAELTQKAVKQSNYILYNIGGNDFLYSFIGKAPELMESITRIMTMLEVSPVQAYLAFQNLTAEISGLAVQSMVSMVNNLTEIIKQTYLINPKAYVVVNGIPGIDLVKGAAALSMDILANATIYDLVTDAVANANEAIKKAIEPLQVTGMRVSFVDVNEAVYLSEPAEDVELFRADGIHFSDYSHEVIGEADKAAFKKLKRNDTLSMIRMLLIIGG